MQLPSNLMLNCSHPHFIFEKWYLYNYCDSIPRQNTQKKSQKFKWIS